jgi:hypothetical protein
MPSIAALGGIVIDVVVAMAPLVGLLVLFQLLFLRLPWRQVGQMLIGIGVAGLGLFLFLAGVAIAYVPFGRAIGTALSALPAWLLVVLGLALGFVTAWGEPAVRILAGQVEDASAGSIRRSLVIGAICVGVGIATAVGLLRIAFSIPILHIVAPAYVLVMVTLWLSNRDFVAIAVDAGGVATGPLTNTFLLAVALGMAAALGDDNPIVGGLGLAALISVAPILTLIGLGVMVRLRTRAKE